MLNITMRKSTIATKILHVSTGPKKSDAVNEHEQLYLVKKSRNL